MTIVEPEMRNRDSDQTLLKAAAKLDRPTVYALAKVVRRPYRRVLTRVKTLAAAGQLQLVPALRAGREVLEVRVEVRVEDRGTVMPSFAVTWSRPDGQVSAEVLIAATLFRPSFSGLLDLSLRYGLSVVEAAATSLAEDSHWHPRARDDALRILRNIRLGHDRVAA